MTSLQGFPCMPLVHFCRCFLNHFDPVLRPLLYSQFLTVRCELYQICAKNPEVSSIKSFVGIQLKRILVIGGLPAM